MIGATCLIPDCGKPPYNARGWCNAHYRRWRRHGDPLAGRASKGEPMLYFREVVLAYEGGECLVWPYNRSGDGYGKLVSGGRREMASRLLCEIVNGPPPSTKHHAAHSCGNGHLGCVTKRHLSWKTPTENASDKLYHGTDGRGERNPRARLTATQVLEIRASIARPSELSNQYGIAEATVRKIRAGSTWRHV